MKYIFVLLSCVFCHLHAQHKIDLDKKITKELDTLHYLKTNFELKKSEYRGKPFSYLLSKMTRIYPRTVWNTPDIKDSTIVERSLFRFYDINYPILNETKMLIIWQTGFSYRTADSYSRRNKYYFTNAEKKLYGSMIIKDILVYR
ncbi:hypothetical protein [Chryseobacterium proteolyticum]|uniref:hypothetical protein n=1 Tax=Chryseobacterium proteolyticum TaxID=118127 RepID=UPI0039837FFB